MALVARQRACFCSRAPPMFGEAMACVQRCCAYCATHTCVRTYIHALKIFGGSQCFAMNSRFFSSTCAQSREATHPVRESLMKERCHIACFTRPLCGHACNNRSHTGGMTMPSRRCGKPRRPRKTTCARTSTRPPACGGMLRQTPWPEGTSPILTLHKHPSTPCTLTRYVRHETSLMNAGTSCGPQHTRHTRYVRAYVGMRA